MEEVGCVPVAVELTMAGVELGSKHFRFSPSNESGAYLDKMWSMCISTKWVHE
jgi:hypothetical protein